MTMSGLAQAVETRLRAAGYEPLRSPFKIASISFDFTAALRGTRGRSLDLVIIVDSSLGSLSDRSMRRTRERVEALNRALDVSESRYTVTTLLLDGPSDDPDVHAMTLWCRVLSVNDVALDGRNAPADDSARLRLDDQLRVLLPLDLPSNPPPDSTAANPLARLRDRLRATADPLLLDSLAHAAQRGPSAVTSALGRVLGDALAVREPHP